VINLVCQDFGPRLCAKHRPQHGVELSRALRLGLRPQPRSLCRGSAHSGRNTDFQVWRDCANAPQKPAERQSQPSSASGFAKTG